MEASRANPTPDRKRKRSAPEPDQAIDSSVGEDQAETSEMESAPTRPSPSEEEVEEFFALLRRIHGADKRSDDGNGRVRSTVFERKLNLTAPLDDGGPSAGKVDRGREGDENAGVMVIDLNAVPDGAEEMRVADANVRFYGAR